MTTIRRPRRALPLASLMTATLATGLLAAALAPGTAPGLGRGAGEGVASPSTIALDASSTERVAYTPTAADQRIYSALNSRVTASRFGWQFTGAVVDAGSSQLIWHRNGTTGRMPASTTKLLTATNILTTYGPNHRFATTVKTGRNANMVHLVGSGDPALSGSQLDSLSATTATALMNRGLRNVNVYADDSLFPPPTLATGWPSSYIPTETTWLRALVYDQRQVADTGIDTAKIFAAKLRSRGIAVSYVGRWAAPAAARTYASSSGQTTGQLVSRMLMWSDNEHAEALHRLAAIKVRYGSSWKAGAMAQRDILGRYGLPVGPMYDGSGLSRSDRLSAIQLARVVDFAFEPAQYTNMALLRSASALPTAGRTGTLKATYGRFDTWPSSCAAGKVYAKTGTLEDAVALAGWTVGKDGRTKTFAFVANGLQDTLTLKRNIDMLAATVNGCY